MYEQKALTYLLSIHINNIYMKSQNKRKRQGKQFATLFRKE